MSKLYESDLNDDPTAQFGMWFEEAQADSGIPIPESACLSTLGPDDAPEGRMVLMKGFDDRGFVFYTNLESNKGRSLARHPKAGLTFHWVPLGRQVRLRGPVEAVSEDEADAYFASRPRGSQLGAWASDQSRELDSREALEAKLQEVTAQYEGGPIPRPPHWSGFRIRPDQIEFWQEGDFRLHDRFVFTRRSGGWSRMRLSP